MPPSTVATKPAVSTARAKAVTIQDVASAVGVTKMTVSNVLNGKPNASPATREAVLRAARELGFVPNPHAQRLSKGHCEQTISLFTLNLDFGVATHKIQHIQQLLQQRGYEVPLHAFGYLGSTPENQAELMSTVRRQRPRAIVCNTDGVQAAALDELQRYQDDGGLVVTYDYPAGLDCDSVSFDREDNTYQAAKHLLDLGHDSLGLFLHGGRGKLLQPRVQGFRRALQEQGMVLREDWLFCDGLYAEGGARLAEQFAALKDRPTAICIVNDLVASTFVNEIQRLGVSVPTDVSVVSLDDTPIARYSAVPLSAVSQPVERIAESVVDLLCRRLNGTNDGASSHIIIRGELHVRQSSAPAGAQPGNSSPF